MQDGFFAGTLNPYNSDALAGVAESVGLDGQRVREILTNNEYADRVRADRREGVELGATGVPFAVLDRRVAAPGAQKVAVDARSLEQVAGLLPPAGGAIPTPGVCHIDTADEAASAEANNEDAAGDVPDVPDATDR